MLRLPSFSFRLPATLDEAATILSGEGPGCRLVAGGTDLWPNMKRRHQKADTVVSLMRVPDLAGIRNGSGLTLGATSDYDNAPDIQVLCDGVESGFAQLLDYS